MADPDHAGFISIVPGLTRHRLTVEITSPCRRCATCLRKKAALWRFRARDETRNAPRTWFGTLTFSPEWRYRLVAAARRSSARIGEDYDALEPLARFRRYANASGSLVTKWLKRVRKQSGVRLRYLLVVEEHKDGAPHYHVLIHEVEPDGFVRKSVLRDNWSHGFSKWKLVEDLRSADYVCKYISKSLMARVRASMRYGKNIRPCDIVHRRGIPDPHTTTILGGQIGD